MDCPVCLESKHNFIWLGCAHKVCTECSARMESFNITECPICRFPMKEPVVEQAQARAVPRESHEVACLRAFGRGCADECYRDRGLHQVAFGVFGLGVLASCMIATLIPRC